MMKRSLRTLLLAACFTVIYDGVNAITDVIDPKSIPSSNEHKRNIEWLALVNEELADVIAEHVRKIFEQGFAEHFSKNDFYHGHFIAADQEKCKQLEEIKGFTEEDWRRLYLSAKPHFLYHTFENTWLRDPYMGLPRSIIGTLGGEIQPVRTDTKNFISHGTVNSKDTFRVGNINYSGMCDAILLRSNSHEGSEIFFNDGKFNYIPNYSQFYILPTPKGRYKANGENFDIYFDIHRLPR